MSMRPQGLEPIPEETRRMARLASRKGTLPMQLRDGVGAVYSDDQFAHLFPKRGRGAEAPWRVALVRVLQATEGLTDRQAAE
jgi:transposase